MDLSLQYNGRRNRVPDWLKKIQEKLKELLPIENTLKEARVIENLHNLIKNNGQNFNLSQEQLELANLLT